MIHRSSYAVRKRWRGGSRPYKSFLNLDATNSRYSDPAKLFAVRQEKKKRHLEPPAPSSLQLLAIRLLDYIILPNWKETTANSIKLRFDESSGTSLTGLSVLLRNAMFIFTLMNPLESILGRRNGFRVRVRSRSPLRHTPCYGTPFLEVYRETFVL